MRKNDHRGDANTDRSELLPDMTHLASHEDACGEAFQPAVPVNDSITPNFLICLETGERMVLLRRHLMQNLHLTPEEYREKWGLPDDYPMTAPNYAVRRNSAHCKNTSNKS